MSSLDISLHPKQAIAFQTEATEVLFGGAKGGGKSHLMRVAPIMWCHLIPGLQVYLFRRISPDLYRNHMQGPSSFWRLLGPWVREGYVAYNGSKNFWQFANGSQINLCHCQYDNDMNNYQGAEIHVLMIDQLEQWSREVYEFLRAQVRIGGLRVPSMFKGMFPRVLNSANPGGIGHNWVKGEWVDVAPEFAITQMPPDRGGMRRQYIPSYLEDNPTMMVNDPTYEDRLNGLGSPAMVKALRRGLWNIVSGGAIDDVWEPSIHVIRPFQVPASWRVDRSLDWGSTKPFSVGWWARSDGSEVMTADGPRSFPPGSKFRVAEYYGWTGRANVGCKMLAVEVARKILEIQRFLPYRVWPGPADNSIWDAENGVCIADDMSRIGVRWTRSDKSPGSRKTRLEKLRTMLKASLALGLRRRIGHNWRAILTEHDRQGTLFRYLLDIWPQASSLLIGGENDPDNLSTITNIMDLSESPGVYIFDTCSQFIRTVPVLPRDPKKMDDIDTNAEDHIYDETGYNLMAPPREDSVEQVAL